METLLKPSSFPCINQCLSLAPTLFFLNPSSIHLEGSRTSLFLKGESLTPLSLWEVKRGDGWSQCMDDLRSPVQEEFGLGEPLGAQEET